ncbi:MAG: 2Fe-2S iron-sulfur cluster-binding protein, partial [Oscillospiraceae bacterium]
MSLVNIKINDMAVQVENGISILAAARQVGIEIPTLCYLKEINEIGACRICVVEVKGSKALQAACVTPVYEGIEVYTSSKKVFEARKQNLELILSTHSKDCLTCVRSGNCELQKLCKDFRVHDENVYKGENIQWPTDDTAVHMIRDNNKCILCRRCVAVCEKWQGISCIGMNERGFETHIGCAFEQSLGHSSCVSCGQCTVVCPTGAIVEKDSTEEVWTALHDPEKFVIAQTAPSIRVTLGEAFDMPLGTNVEGKMVAALRRLG